MDGRAFLARDATRYDLIWLDAYGADSVPAHLTTVEFFRLVRARLAPGGAVAANLWGPGVNPRYHSQVRAIQEAFPETYVLAEHLPGQAGTNGPGWRPSPRWLPDRRRLPGRRVWAPRPGSRPPPPCSSAGSSTWTWRRWCVSSTT